MDIDFNYYHIELEFAIIVLGDEAHGKEGKQMANEYFNCQAKECFGNCFGKCQILTSKIEGKPCPFYKTRTDLRNERVSDVINKWETRKGRK